MRKGALFLYWNYHQVLSNQSHHILEVFMIPTVPISLFMWMRIKTSCSSSSLHREEHGRWSSSEWLGVRGIRLWFFIGQCRSFNLLDKVSWGSYLGFLSFYAICLRKVLGFMECRFLNLGKRKEDWNKSSLPSSFPIVS
jgi:hypothetical protein